MSAGLVHVPGDTTHRDSRGDDYIRQLGQQVIAGAAGPLPAVYLLTELPGSSSQFRRRGWFEWLPSLPMVDHEEQGRDLAHVIVPLVGRLEETDDLWEPYRLLDGAGVPVRPAAAYLKDLQAAGRSQATLRSYGMDLLRWFRPPPPQQVDRVRPQRRFRLPRRQQVPQENRHRLHNLAARPDYLIGLMGIAGGHETARPRHHEPRQITSLFLIRFDHADKLAPITENTP
jgi:hypothetical protein